MTLFDKVMHLYPDLKLIEFTDGTIRLQDDSDGRGNYIVSWNHPVYPKPTDEQLASIVE